MSMILRNFCYYHGDDCRTGQAMVLADGHIRHLLTDEALPADARAQAVDCGGLLLAPGFIDTQVNGGGGVMFNSHPDLETLDTMRRGHWCGGTTAMLPTLITDSHEHMQQAVTAVAQALDSLPGIVGIHMEGPHLNRERRGTHAAGLIRPFDALTESLLEPLPPHCCLLTVAPETLPAGTIRRLRARGLHVSAGHTSATHAQIVRALAEGLDGFTHLYNAMTPMSSREPGVVGAALAHEHSWCGIIVDGIHLHPVTAALAIRAKARGRMVLVTDAMATVGSSHDHFELYGETIRVQDGRCVNADGVLAGSALDMASAVRNCVSLLGLALPEALRMASLYPAQWLGLDQERGYIAPGWRADLVLLNAALEVEKTWVGAELCYARP